MAKDKAADKGKKSDVSTKMKGGAAGGLGRLEKIKDYGPKGAKAPRK